MSSNPLLNGQNTNLTPENPVNNRSKEFRPSYSTFSLKAITALTSRFGDVTPFEVTNIVAGDNHRFGTKHDMRTYTLGAPLMSPISQTKSYFFVPNQAILPENYDRIEINPKFGEDIPEDAHPSFDFKLLSSYFDRLVDVYSEREDLYLGFYLVALSRNLFSYGSLLSYLGYSFPKSLYKLDDVFDNLVRSLSSSTVRISYYDVVGTSRIAVDDVDVYGVPAWRSFFDSIEESSRFEILEISDDVGDVLLDYLHSVVSSLTYALDLDKNFIPWNLKRVLAYQLAVAHFFSNDDLDNISTSSLYMDNLRELGRLAMGLDDSPTFTQNGIKHRYDIISGRFLFNVMDRADLSLDQAKYSVLFFLNLFVFGRSLRFGDYFAGARTRPLAVGDVTVGVVNNEVQVEDISVGISRRRFLNLVNRAKSGLANYRKALFGVVPDDNPSIPKFLASSHSGVGNPESSSENGYTGVPTSDLRSNDSNYEFTMEFKDSGVLLGLISYEVIGCYPNLTDRQNLLHDRFEEFNPMCQTFGDQPIYCQEIGVDVADPSSPWAYQQKYAEYKNSCNRALGGFASGALPGWIFMPKQPTFVLSPSFIRHSRSEFDKFYSSLTGSSLSSYFHFQTVFSNELTSNRPMEFDSPVL